MKPDTLFAFENAAWPVLLLDGGGNVLRANAAAVKLLGPALEGGSPQLSTFWAAENTVPAEQFLGQWERAPSPTVAFKLRIRGGAVAQHTGSLCERIREFHTPSPGFSGSSPLWLNDPGLTAIHRELVANIAMPGVNTFARPGFSCME